MSLVAPDTNPSVDASTAQFAPQITGLTAGEDLLALAPCYIKSSDGKVYMSNGTAATEPAEIVGFTPRACKAGESTTLFGKGMRFHYAPGTLTPGDKYFIAATAGRLDTAATTGDALGVTQAINASEMRVIRDSF